MHTVISIFEKSFQFIFGTRIQHRLLMCGICNRKGCLSFKKKGGYLSSGPQASHMLDLFLDPPFPAPPPLESQELTLKSIFLTELAICSEVIHISFCNMHTLVHVNSLLVIHHFIMSISTVCVMYLTVPHAATLYNINLSSQI